MRRQITPLSPSIQQFSNDPKVWGPHAWIFIHTIASQYPNHPTADDKQKFKTFFTILSYVLPCTQCGMNMMTYIQQNYTAFLRAFDNRQSLFNWTVNFHNFVNSSERQQSRSNLQPKRTIL